MQVCGVEERNIETQSNLLEDQQGSVSSILNADGSTLVNENFTAYGDRRDPTTWNGSASSDDLSVSAGVTRQGYTWQTALGNMGLNHMNGRVQDAITGVFLSPDPYISEPGNPQNYNRYSYVLNNPLSFTDPSGYKQQARIRFVHGKRQSGRWHGTGAFTNTTFTGTNDENGKADYVTWEEGYYEPDYSSSPLGALFFHDASYFINSMVSDLINYDDGPANGGDDKKHVELAAQTSNHDPKQMACKALAKAQAVRPPRSGGSEGGISGPMADALGLSEQGAKSVASSSHVTGSQAVEATSFARAFSLASRGLTAYSVFAAPSSEHGYAAADAVINEALSYAFEMPGAVAGVLFNIAGGTKALGQALQYAGSVSLLMELQDMCYGN